ncbi:MAG: hypothetical protein K2Q13_10010 [Nitrosomonas sp.]|uniref:hypothetical protein n=1 Tax=Nitrosomonas sp. TaxID=42353 RepID=UPI0025D807B9|nr:hypothetical protein [Nitrosomonas sp.]MBY0475375.1 hypothetical protein [Nitrosomonas sp.]
MPRFINIPAAEGIAGPTGPKAGPPFIYSVNTADQNPGGGYFRLSDADVSGTNFMYFNATTSDGYDMTDDFGAYEVGGRLYFEQSVGNKRATFLITSIEFKTTYWKIGVVYISGVNFVAGNYVLTYYDTAETRTYTDLADPSLPPAVSNPGMAVILDNISGNATGQKCLAVSDGSVYNVVGRVAILHDNETHALVFPNTSITWTASDVDGFTKLVASGPHGLTGGVCDGKANLHIGTASTGFELNDLLAITTINNTTDIQTSFPWPGGTPDAPIISAVGATGQLKPTKTPPLRANSRIIIDANYIASGSGAKTVVVKLGGNDIFTPPNITTATTLHIPVEVYNKNATDSQETRVSIASATGYGTGAPGAAFAVETSSGAADITFNFSAASVNELIGVRSRLIELVH